MKNNYSIIFKPNDGQWMDAKKEILSLCESVVDSRNKIVQEILNKKLNLAQAQFLYTQQSGLDLKLYGLLKEEDLQIIKPLGYGLLNGLVIEFKDEKLICIKSPVIKTLDYILILKYLEDYRVWQAGAYALTQDGTLKRKFGHKNKSYAQWFKKHQSIDF